MLEQHDRRRSNASLDLAEDPRRGGEAGRRRRRIRPSAARRAPKSRTDRAETRRSTSPAGACSTIASSSSTFSSSSQLESRLQCEVGARRRPERAQPSSRPVDRDLGGRSASAGRPRRTARVPPPCDSRRRSCTSFRSRSCSDHRPGAGGLVEVTAKDADRQVIRTTPATSDDCTLLELSAMAAASSHSPTPTKRPHRQLQRLEPLTAIADLVRAPRAGTCVPVPPSGHPLEEAS